MRVAISPSRAHSHGDVTSNADILRGLLSECSLEIDAIRVGAGIVRVRAVNVGTLRHNLTVTKAGTFSEIYQTTLLDPGEVVELPLLFAEGVFVLCYPEIVGDGCREIVCGYCYVRGVAEH